MIRLLSSVLMASAAFVLAGPSASAAGSMGTIAGTVTAAGSGAPIAGIHVCAAELESNLGDSELELEFLGQCTTTKTGGTYTTPELRAGLYLVEFSSGGGGLNYAPQFYNAKEDASEAELIAVSTGQTVGIDAALAVGGQIEGTVTNVVSSAAAQGVTVCASSEATESCATTGANGQYVLSGLSSGAYRIWFYSETGAYLSQYYNATTEASEAASVTVEAGHTKTAINAALQPASEISGKVTSKATKAAIAGIEVCAIESTMGLFGQCTTTGSSGQYTISGLPEGSYTVEFATAANSELNYSTQYYNGKAALAEATAINLKTGAAKTGINTAMTPGGEITGQVTAAGTKANLSGITACASEPLSEAFERCATTASSGQYTIAGLAAGSYDVAFRSTGSYATQYWKNASSAAEEQAVAVTAGTTTAGISAAMQPAGAIAGEVLAAASNTALAEVTVCAFEAKSELPAQCTTTASTGKYTLGGLASGEYKVEFNLEDGEYAPQYWEDEATASEATPISVVAGQTTSAINASLSTGGTITGAVIAQATHAPLAGIEVCAYPALAQGSPPCTTTNGRGEYALNGLAADEYLVEFASYALNYLTEYYPSAARITESDLIAVEAGKTTSGINAAMHGGGQITGTVTEAATGNLLSGIEVCAYTTSNGGSGRCASTAENGVFELHGLATGTYTAEYFASGSDYLPQYRNGKETLAEAEDITVEAEHTTSEVNATMQIAATMSGTVTSAATKAGLPGIAVAIENLSGVTVASTTTGPSGEYTVTGLYPGNYKVEYSGSGYLAQYWEGKTTLEEAQEIALSSGQARTGINAVMRTPGSLAGTVTSLATNQPLEGVTVAVLRTDGSQAGIATSGPHGEYSVGELSPGKYDVRFEASGYLTQYYNSKSQLAEANEVEVAAESTTSAINAAMQTGGTITGEVTGYASQTAIAGAEVAIDEPSGNQVAATTTNEHGEYHVSELTPGQYEVRFAAFGYLTQYYDAKAQFSEAEELTIEAEKTSGHVDAVMRTGGTIAGQVTSEATQAGIENGEVAVEEPSGNEIASTTTNEHGEYSIGELAPGQYKVRFTASGYLTQYYNAKSQLSEAQEVGVEAEKTVGAINAMLERGGTITGKVISVKKKPIAGIDIAVENPNQQTIVETTSNSKGEYAVAGVPAGAYKIQFSGSGYVTQYWNTKANFSEGQEAAVENEHTTAGINATMQRPGSITGVVTSASTKTDLAGAEVDVYSASDTSVATAYTGSEGAYTVYGLAPGSYKVQFNAYGYESQYYKGKSTFAAGKPVAVKAEKAKAKINAAMRPSTKQQLRSALPGSANSSVNARVLTDPPQDPGTFTAKSDTATTATCPAMKVFGVRGSGETDADYGGYGHTVKSVIETIEQEVPDTSAQMIDYQAIEVAWWNPSYYIYRYHDSVQSGIDSLHNQIAKFVSGSCGKTTYIYLVGYSQGADVVAETYQRALSATEKARVQGIALLGDPHFNPHESGIDVGGYNSTNFGVLVNQGQAARDFTSGEAPLVHSYCGFTDGICSYDLINIGLCAAKKCDHLHYWNEMLNENETYTEAAAKFLISRWDTVGPQVVHVGPRRSVLVFGTDDPQEDPTGSGTTNIVAALRRDGYSVTVSAQLPPNISNYGQVWWYGYRPTVDLTGNAETELIDYARAGGSLYLTGEWDGCCETPDDDEAVKNIFDSLVITVGGLQFGPNFVAHFPINYGAIDHVAERPDRLKGFFGNLAGTLSGSNLGTNNFVATDGEGDGTIGVWDSSEVTGGGRLAIVMDVNWAQDTYGEPSQVPPIVTNLAYFLSGGAAD